MTCETCGTDLPAGVHACAACGSIGLRLTIAPRHVLEFGVVTSLIFAFAAAVQLLLGMTWSRGVIWWGVDVGILLMAGGVVSLCATVPLLFSSSVVAMRMLERARSMPTAVAERSQVATAGTNAAGSLAASWEEVPGSVVEHTTLRLVIHDDTTEKVPVQR